MEKFIVLSDGDKLKEIRRRYALKQEEITGREITRNLISEIETNKASITKKTAEIVIKNLTALAKKRNFEVSETVDYLMENQVIQATKVLDNYIKELETLSISKDNSFMNALRDAESFLIEWDIKDKKLRIYELAGDYFCNNNEMYKSAVYYEKALALLSRVFLDRELLPLSRKLSTVYEYIGDYKKSIECCEFALSHFSDMSKEYKIVFRYNVSLAYKDINNLQSALHNINIAETLVDKDDTEKLFNILTNKANYLYKLKSYKESIDLNNKILRLINKKDIEKQLLTHINIISNYIALEMKEDVINALEFLIENLSGIGNDSLYIADIYFEVGKIYEYVNNLEELEKFYLKALDFSEKHKDYVLESNILSNLVDFYIKCNNVKMMESIKNKIFALFNKQGYLNGALMYKLFYFYSNNNKIIKELSIFALQFN